MAELRSPDDPDASVESASRTLHSPLAALSLRALVISLVITILCAVWIRQAELLSFTCQITESIPPITGLATLLLFAALRPILRGRWQPSRAELCMIYVFVSIATVMSAVGVTQAFLPYLLVPFYFPEAGTKLGEIREFLPGWLGPRDEETIRTFFEGSDTGRVPWADWAGPLALWLLFLLAFWWTATCLFVIFRKQWTDKERLTYPIVSIPIRLTEQGGSRGNRPFLRDPLMWMGFSLALVYHVVNVLHIINPSVVAPGPYYPLGQFFTERPLNVLAGLSIWHRPELIGLGYLVPLEILFSVWFFFVLQQVIAVLGAAVGYEGAGYPYMGDQGMGAYIGTAFFLVWVARRHLAGVIRCALRGGGDEDRDEPLSYRTAVFGLLLGFSFLVLFACRAGVALRVALMFFGLLFTFLLTYTRIRCESGTPSIWSLPHSELKFLPFRMFGSDAFKIGGSYQTLSVWTTFFFLVHGGFFNQTTVLQMESFRLGDELGVRRRTMARIGLSAVFIGLVIAFVMFLHTYYAYGTNVLAGGGRSGTGGVRISYCLESWMETSNYMTTPVAAERPRQLAFGTGFVLTIALLIVRTLTLKSPLSPLGYIMASINGTQLWWAFLLAWMAKSAVLRLGGVTLYHRLMPFFLGIALGHFFIGGVVWGTLAIFWPDVEYVIWFT